MKKGKRKIVIWVWGHKNLNWGRQGSFKKVRALSNPQPPYQTRVKEMPNHPLFCGHSGGWCIIQVDDNFSVRATNNKNVIYKFPYVWFFFESFSK